MNINTTDKVQLGDSTAGTNTSTTWRCPYTKPRAEQGWECPRCGRINAPWKSQCDCSGSNWTITSNWTYRPKWMTEITCHEPKTVLDSDDTFKVHPETTTWEAPSSICGSDSTTRQNPDSTIYTTATNPTVGGSDYWDNMSQVWTNNPHVSNKVNPNTITTAWNNGPSTQTIHNGKTNYRE